MAEAYDDPFMDEQMPEEEQSGKSDEEIVSILRAQLELAVNDESGQISEERQNGLKAYRGDPDGYERDNHSKIVTREVFESVEWLLPSIVRPFVAGDRAVEFCPLNQEDEPRAEQESDVINHLVLEEGDGAATFYQWFKSLALQPNAYVKVYHEEKQRRATEDFEGLTQAELVQLSQNPEYEMLAYDERQEIIQGVPVPVFDVTTRRTWMEGKNKWGVVPPEEVLLDNNLETWDVDESPWVCHRYMKSYSDLAKEGFDTDRLDALGESDQEEIDQNSERVYRFRYTEENSLYDDEGDPSQRMFQVHEWYGEIDADGDGVSEYRQIIMVNEKIFYNEEVSYQPIVGAALILEAHRHTGTSMYDIVKDLQRYNTQLKRGMLDNANDINDPKRYVGEGAMSHSANTLAFLLDDSKRYIPTEDPNQIIPEQHQPIIGELLSAMQNLDGDKQMRTGVAPQMSLDPSVLKQATEGAYINAEAAASQRLEMIIRNLAATCVRRVMIKFHQLMRMYPDQKKTVQIRGDYVEVDPTQWPERPEMRIKVGLGYNNTQQNLNMLQGMMALQEKLMAMRMIDPQHAYHSAKEYVKAANLGNVANFVKHPSEIKPPEPDPTQVAAVENLKADSAAKIAKAEKDRMDAQTKAMEAQMETASLKNQLAELMATVENIGADTELKQAQAIKQLADAKGDTSGSEK